MSESRPGPVPVAPTRGSVPLEGHAGAPVLVLGDSLGTSAAVWDRQVPALREQFRLLRYELPGHGGTAAAPGPYTIAGLGAGVLALLDSLGVERAAYCGISLGGMIGMWLAAHAPARVSALGLVCTSAYLPPAESWRARAQQVRAAGLAAISGAVVGRWFTPAFAAAVPQVVARFRDEFERTDPAGYAACCEAIAAMDLRDQLGRITAPTLVLAGADDPATPPDHAAVIAGFVPGAELQVIPDAAHLAPIEAADAVTAALSGHLRAAAGSGDACGSGR